jgi:hypothetical protein
VVLLIAGLLIGVSASGTDLLNPHTSAAEANRVNAETAHQQALYQLQERLATTQTEAEIREIRRQQEFLEARHSHDVQALSQDLVHQDLEFRTWMTVLVMIFGALTVTLFLSTVIWVTSRAMVYIRSIPQKGESMTKYIPPIEQRIPNLPERQPYDPWNSPAHRRSKRTAARQAEREAIAARMMSFRDPGQIGTEEYNSSPEAK